MKKIIFYVFANLILIVGFAQKKALEKAKNYLQSKKFDKAIASINEASTNSETSSLPETWYVKGLIFQGLASDEELGSKNLNAIDTAFEAYQKCYKLNPEEFDKYKLLYSSNVNQFLYVYSLYYKVGADKYNKKDYLEALTYFSKALETHSVIIGMPEKELSDLDTNLCINLALTCENLSAEAGTKNDKEGEKKYKNKAAVYYEMLGNAGVQGETYVGIYKWLCFHFYQTEPNETKLIKFLTEGKKLYPNEIFFKRVELDKERKKSPVDYNLVFSIYADLLKVSPDDLELLKAYSSDLFSYVHPSDRSTPKPENFVELEKNLDDIYETLLKKDEKNKKDVYIDYGKHKYNQFIYALNNDFKNKRADIQKEKLAVKSKINSLSGKKDRTSVAKRKGYEADYDNLNLKADSFKKIIVDPFLDKAISLLETTFKEYDSITEKFTPIERSIFKSCVDLLINCYTEKNDRAKVDFYEDKYDSANKR